MTLPFMSYVQRTGLDLDDAVTIHLAIQVYKIKNNFFSSSN